MSERKIIKIVRRKKTEKVQTQEIRDWQFSARLYGFVGRQHLIKIGDLLWYDDHSRFKPPEQTWYLYPVEVIELGKDNEKNKSEIH